MQANSKPCAFRFGVETIQREPRPPTFLEMADTPSPDAGTPVTPAAPPDTPVVADSDGGAAPTADGDAAVAALGSDNDDDSDFADAKEEAEKSADDEDDDSMDDVDESVEDKMLKATECKSLGNDCFKAKANDDAKKHYVDGIKALKSVRVVHSMELWPQVQGLQMSLHSNLAAVLLNQSEWAGVVKNAGAALALDEENAKALYRRGVGRFRMGALSAAKADLAACIRKDPKNKNARTEYAALQEALVAKKAEDKLKFGGMFGGDSMYGDREAERKAKKRREFEESQREEAEEKAKEEALHQEWEDEVIRRGCTPNTPPIAWDDFKADREKAEKEAKEAKEKETKEADEAKQKAKEEETRLRREARAREHDVVVVDDDDELGLEVKGYKKKADGSTTSFFDRSEKLSDIAKVQNFTPQKLAATPPKAAGEETSPRRGSQWNKAGTWEEKDVSGWATEHLSALLKGASAESSGDMMDLLKDMDFTKELGGGAGGMDGNAMDSLAKVGRQGMGERASAE